jgi:2-hydroxychromene-2-carboxylate isomerase
MRVQPIKRLEFWFDFASTYSYVAAMRIQGLCSQRDVDLEWRPFALGPIFQMQGWDDSPFNLNARRGAYMWRDMERLAKKGNLPWRKPSVFPRNSVLAARIACAADAQTWCGDFIRRVFVGNFGEDLDIGDPSILAALLDEVGAPEGFPEKATSPEFRGSLRRNTEIAIDLGIFGAPNCVVDGELFWGEEALEDALDWATLTRPARGESPSPLNV